MGVSVAGIQNNNRHIQALECLRSNNNNENNKVVAYAAWQHVREFFNVSIFFIILLTYYKNPLTIHYPVIKNWMQLYGSYIILLCENCNHMLNL